MFPLENFSRALRNKMYILLCIYIYSRVLEREREREREREGNKNVYTTACIYFIFFGGTEFFPVEIEGGINNIYKDRQYRHFKRIYFSDSSSMKKFIEVLSMLSAVTAQVHMLVVMSTGYFAQAIDLSGFNDILFLFMGLAQIALAIAVALIVIKVVLDLLGLDILGMAKTVFRGK
jgi:hypothetical protein